MHDFVKIEDKELLAEISRLCGINHPGLFESKDIGGNFHDTYVIREGKLFKKEYTYIHYGTKLLDNDFDYFMMLYDIDYMSILVYTEYFPYHKREFEMYDVFRAEKEYYVSIRIKNNKIVEFKKREINC